MKRNNDARIIPCSVAKGPVTFPSADFPLSRTIRKVRGGGRGGGLFAYTILFPTPSGLQEFLSTLIGIFFLVFIPCMNFFHNFSDCRSLFLVSFFFLEIDIRFHVYSLFLDGKIPFVLLITKLEIENGCKNMATIRRRENVKS